MKQFYNSLDEKKLLQKAMTICDDYSTETPDTDDIEMFWFTPKQLINFARYVLKEQQRQNNSETTTE